MKKLNVTKNVNIKTREKNSNFVFLFLYCFIFLWKFSYIQYFFPGPMVSGKMKEISHFSCMKPRTPLPQNIDIDTSLI